MGADKTWQIEANDQLPKAELSIGRLSLPTGPGQQFGSLTLPTPRTRWRTCAMQAW